MWFDKEFQRLKSEAAPLYSQRTDSNAFTRFTKVEARDLEYLDRSYRDIFFRSICLIIPGTAFAWLVLRRGRIPEFFRNPLLEKSTKREAILGDMQGFFAKSCIFFGSSFTLAYYTIKYDTVKMF
jgi:hypothetical protein